RPSVVAASALRDGAVANARNDTAPSARRVRKLMVNPHFKWRALWREPIGLTVHATPLFDCAFPGAVPDAAGPRTESLGDERECAREPQSSFNSSRSITSTGRHRDQARANDARNARSFGTSRTEARDTTVPS